MATTFVNTYAMRYDFIDKEFVQTVCQVLQIKPKRLIKLKKIYRFDDRVAILITYTIYLTLTIDTHTENLAFCL